VKKLSEIGERKAIELIFNFLSKKNGVFDIGDDCAVINFGGKYLLISTDIITKKTHIHKNMNPWQIGWFAVAINLSDLAAKGGLPLGLVLSLGLPRNTSENFLIDLIKGANSCAVKYGTVIIGGDTKENDNITICGTILGQVDKNKFMGRKGAKSGDVVAITGTLGKAAVGYISLEEGIINRELIKGLFEPKPRLNEGQILSNLKMINSCMDISDGLSSSLYQLKELNNIGFDIYLDKIPFSQNLINYANQKGFDFNKYGLHYGGDYELLMTISPDKFENVKKIMAKHGTCITSIGKVIQDDKIYLIGDNSKKILRNKGFEHFK